MWHNSNERDKVPNATNHNKFLSNKCSPWEQIPNANATNNRQILTWCRAFLESKFQIRSMKLKLVKLCSPWEPKHQSIQRTVLQLWVPQIEPWLKHLFPEYCFLYLLQKCHFKYTVYVSLYLYLYVEELFALTENNNKKWRLALPCVLRSHDYHVTGGANQNADMQIKTKQKKKGKK